MVANSINGRFGRLSSLDSVQAEALIADASTQMEPDEKAVVPEDVRAARRQQAVRELAELHNS